VQMVPAWLTLQSDMEGGWGRSLSILNQVWP
jgi:hypothetical protein